MEIKIRFTMYFRKQITSVLMCALNCSLSNPAAHQAALLTGEALLAAQSGQPDGR